MHAQDCDADDSRTLLKRYLLDPVLPLLALLCMSALTVATIVLLAVTTANARFGHGGADTRIRWGSSPSILLPRPGGGATGPVDPVEWEEMEAGPDLPPVARWMP